MSDRSNRSSSRPNYGEEVISTGTSINKNSTSQRTSHNYGLDDEGIGRLSHKVGLLKQISIDMGEEISEGNRELVDMNGELDNAAAQLQDAIKRFYLMAQAQARGGGIYVYLLLFVLFVMFVVIYRR